MVQLISSTCLGSSTTWSSYRRARSCPTFPGEALLVLPSHHDRSSEGRGFSDRMSPDELPPLEGRSLTTSNVVLMWMVLSVRLFFGYSDCGRLLAPCMPRHIPDRMSALILYATAAVRIRRVRTTSSRGPTQSRRQYLAGMRTRMGEHGCARESLSFFDPSLAGDEQMSAWYASSSAWPRARRRPRPWNAICHEIDMRGSCPRSACQPLCSIARATRSRVSRPAATSPLGYREPGS